MDSIQFVDVDEYVDFIMHEVKKLKQNKFYGNVKYQFHFQEGNIKHMGCEMTKTVKLNRGG